MIIFWGFAGNRIISGPTPRHLFKTHSHFSPSPYITLLFLVFLFLNTAVMSEEASHGNLLQNHSCDFLNSDSNSGGSGGEKFGEKPPDSSSNNPIEKPLGIAMVGRKRGRRAKASSDGGGGGGVESEHETHIWTERERRKKMRNMFSSLHALLPQLPPKVISMLFLLRSFPSPSSFQHTLKFFYD